MFDFEVILAKTEPATTGGQPQAVWVSRYGDDPIVISEVSHSVSATSAPFPDLDELPTVTSVIESFND